MAELKLESAVTGSVGLLRLSGSVDAATVGDFERGLNAHVSAGRHRVVVSLRNVTFMSSAGWGAMLGVVKDVRSRNGAVVLAAMTPDVRHVYGLLGMRTFFKEFASEEQAVESLK